MAVLTHTVSSFSPVGENALITGQITVPDANKNHMALLPSETGYIQSCQVQAATELATDPLVAINTNTSLDTVNGSVLIEAAGSCSLTYTAIVSGGPF